MIIYLPVTYLPSSPLELQEWGSHQPIDFHEELGGHQFGLVRAQ